MSTSLCLLTICTFVFLSLASASILPTSNWQIADNVGDETLLVAVGGSNGTGVVSDVSIYSLTTNSQKDNGAPTPKPLELFGSAIFNDTIYIINGMDNESVAQNEFWAYNVAKNMWIDNLPDAPAATVGSQAVEVGGRIYVLGGMTDVKNPAYNDQVFVYSTRLRKWYVLNTTIPQTDDNPCAVVQEQHLYYLPAGGLFHSDDGAVTWETLAAPSVNRSGGACVAIGMDAIMLMGGQNAVDFYDSVEIYNITSNTWKTVASMNVVRSGAWAVLMPGDDNQNTVLVCGGAASDDDDEDVSVTQSCETYDLQNDEWTLSSITMDQPRVDFGLFVLPPV